MNFVMINHLNMLLLENNDVSSINGQSIVLTIQNSDFSAIFLAKTGYFSHFRLNNRYNLF